MIGDGELSIKAVNASALVDSPSHCSPDVTSVPPSLGLRKSPGLYTFLLCLLTAAQNDSQGSLNELPIPPISGTTSFVNTASQRLHGPTDPA